MGYTRYTLIRGISMGYVSSSWDILACLAKWDKALQVSISELYPTMRKLVPYVSLYLRLVCPSTRQSHLKDIYCQVSGYITYKNNQVRFGIGYLSYICSISSVVTVLTMVHLWCILSISCVSQVYMLYIYNIP